MNAEKIYDILLKFSSNNQRGLLIDGSWGIGKTYQINRFLEKIEADNKKEKDKSKKTKIIYSSLFGLDSISELHTELFAKLNPFANIVKNAVGVISPAFSLIPYAGEAVSSSVSYAIGKVDENIQKPKNKIKRKTTKKRIIIILDDIERVSPSFDYSTLLGYINQTYLAGLKIVCICDATKIKNEGFEELKEKVFDRYYKVTKANEDIIKMYFGKDAIFLDNTAIELFNNNLRTASKTSLFYFEIKKYLESLDVEKYHPIKNNIILWYVLLIVTSLNQELQVIDYKRKKSDYLYNYFNSYFKDENLSDKLNKCYQFDCNSKHIGKILDRGYLDRKELLLALSFAYLYDDFSLIEDLLKVHDEVNDSYIPLFYLSTKDRVEEIKRIISSIDTIDVMSEKQFKRILSIFECEEIKSIKYDEKAIVNKLAEKCLKAEEKVVDSFYFLNIYPKVTQKILISIKEAYHELLIKDLIKKLKEKFLSGDYDQICNLLSEIKQKDYCHIRSNNVYDLIPEIKDCFAENKYFLPIISGTIQEEDWHLVHTICDFIYDFAFREVFSSYLLEIKGTTKDVDERNRVNALLEEYYPNLLEKQDK